MSHSAFELWDTNEKNLVKAYCDEYPALSDSEMVTQIHTQRAVGFWHETIEEPNSQENQDNQQCVIDCIALYDIQITDAPVTIGIKINSYIQSLPVQDQAAALAQSNTFWGCWDDIGFITEVQTTITESVIPDIVESDIQQIRSM